MISSDPPCPSRPFWHDALLALVVAAATPLAHHAGKAVREALASRRGDKREPK